MTRKVTLFLFLSAFLSFSMVKAEAKNDVSSETEKDSHDFSDPLESFNRPMFTFNYQLDQYLLKPAAKGYRAVTTKEVREGVLNASSNIKEPISVANYTLQLEPKNAAISVGRFAINSTLGLFGLFDVATGWGMTNEKTTFDETLANWCVPDGTYLVLPFWGSTTPRNTVGRLADNFANPVYWVTNQYEDGIYAYGAYAAAEAIISREASMDMTEDFEKNSVDLYATVRSAFLQNRSKYGCHAGDSNVQSYDFDFDIEE